MRNIKIVFLSILGLLVFFQSHGQSKKKQNVIFILADDLGWKDLKCYGSDYYETPNIDALAKSGMLFTNAYTASPLCSPTRASILTGQEPGRLRFTTPS
ncbi:MAG: sulfatase-like hydrolase/transferase, partial [Saonia sp.]